jgi:DNA polymerase III subunit gamma/tau
VYILDEVHMLSKAAEAALLKTLEEPPPHVVFVLATTDPQKVSETIRSRTQHLQFHLLPMDVMEQHIRWLAADAGLDVTDQAVQAVLRRGGGSARDTISALELVASGGGDAEDETPLDEFVEALIESDPGRALAAVASVVRQGRDSRTLTELLVAHLRDCFLSLMAPELVQLPDQRAEEVGVLAHRLGAATTVRAMEVLGTMLVEMRHAPDPRVLLEVALVKLTSASADPGVAALSARIERLEQQIARGGGGGAGPAPASSGGSAVPGRGPSDPGAGPSGSAPVQSSPAAEAPRDPATGRAVLGGRIRRDPPTGGDAPAPTSTSPADSGGPAAPPPLTTPAEKRAMSERIAALAASAPPPAPDPDSEPTPPPRPAAHPAQDQVAVEAEPVNSEAVESDTSSLSAEVSVPADSSADTSSPETTSSTTEDNAGGPPAVDKSVSLQVADEPVDATEAPVAAAAAVDASVTPLRPASEGPITSAQLATAHTALIASMRPLAKAVMAAGSFVTERNGTVELAVPSDPLKRRAEDQRADIERGLSEHFGRPLKLSVVVDASARSAEDSSMPQRPAAPTQAEEDDIDVSELVDAPTEPVVNNIDRIAAAFPGSQLIEDRE